MPNASLAIVFGCALIVGACAAADPAAEATITPIATSSATNVSSNPEPTSLTSPSPTRAPEVMPTAVAPAESGSAAPRVTPTSLVDPDPGGVLPPEVVAEIPTGYRLLGQAEGDLNLDGRSDLAIIVHQPDDGDFGPPPDEVAPRPVLLFLRQADGKLELATRGDHVALCGRCGGAFGDPFVDLAIGPGTISVSHYGGSAWRWTYTPTFAYDIVENDWVLTGVSETTFHATDPDATLEDHSTSDVDPIAFADYQSPW